MSILVDPEVMDSQSSTESLDHPWMHSSVLTIDHWQCVIVTVLPPRLTIIELLEHIKGRSFRHSPKELNRHLIKGNRISIFPMAWLIIG